ncbi:ABC transporter ATP-binding protein [Desulfovibrio sp. OttesenSCG-928-O18]|nr:ABC transporter ATP-binding protein [Desulfovibrio sp. OttesenSCG-928-O18]
MNAQSSPVLTNPSSATPPVVRLCGITKHFGKVKANHKITLDIHAGKIKALLGENGAGKSTLMSILAGKLLPDRGWIMVDGRSVALSSPKDALRLGIGMVYQHFSLVDSMTVAENVVLGQTGGFFLNRRGMLETVAALADRYGLALDPSARVHSLSMGEKQRVEIAKLLYRDSRVLILDEPTAVLTPQEAEQLFSSMRAMAKAGKAIVFISHKMQEVLDVADDIAILRRGLIVDAFDRESVPDKAELASRMLGRELAAFEPAAPPRMDGEPEVVLETSHLGGNGLHDVSFTLRRGEILAVAGVAGNGQKELVETLCGLIPLRQGDARILGKPWKAFYPAAPRHASLAYIPEDRLHRAVCPEFSLAENFLLTTRTEFSNGPWLRRKEAGTAAAETVATYGVVPANKEAAAKSFSGGNLQKFVIGRELFREPKIIIAENPTQGLDVAAAEEVWHRLLKARENAGILLVTGDLAEALLLATRIIVMFQGRIMDTFDRSDTRKVSRIGLLMAGIPESHEDQNTLPGII